MTSESEDVLKALSSSTRRTIMRQISERGSATYTEIMQVLDLDPSVWKRIFLNRPIQLQLLKRFSSRQVEMRRDPIMVERGNRRNTFTFDLLQYCWDCSIFWYLYGPSMRFYKWFIWTCSSRYYQLHGRAPEISDNKAASIYYGHDVSAMETTNSLIQIIHRKCRLPFA